MGKPGAGLWAKSTPKWARFGIDSHLKRCQERRAAGVRAASD
jgi:hypothetical protein